jgi:8-oxo-dGTP pyrophosphatase MutT (NUDIX family)
MTPDSDPPIRQLSTRTGYSVPHLHVIEDEIAFASGGRGLYSYIDKADFALVIPYERGGFWLVEQYRYPVKSRQWEFPQGGWPVGHTGTAANLAAAELREEVGAIAADWHHLGHLFAAYGHSNQGYDIFLATGLTHGEPDREETEQDMRHEWFSGEQVRAMILDSTIADAHTVASWGLLGLSRPELTGASN